MIKSHKAIRDMILFAMFAALIFASQIVFSPLPNIHPVAMLIMVLTIVYRGRALIPIYLYLFLLGLYDGFAQWWYPYLYIWLFLWGLTMLIPKNISEKKAVIVYPLVCAISGLTFGSLYAPAQALMYGYDFKTTLIWIFYGLPFDAIHAVGNLAMGTLVYPLVKLIKKIM